jgi:hypothetical protein
MVRWRVQSVAARFTGSKRPLVVDGDSARMGSLRGSALSHFGVRRERGHGGVEWCGADKPGEAVVADPNSPVVAVLRHRELDNWLRGGERETKMLQRGVCAGGKEGGKGRTLMASLWFPCRSREGKGREREPSQACGRKERGPVGRSTRGSRPVVAHGARSGGGEWRYVEAITGRGVR